MTVAHLRLARALILSLALHGLVLLAGFPLPLSRIERPMQPPLSVYLDKEPAPAPPAPPLMLPPAPVALPPNPIAERPRAVPRESKPAPPRPTLPGETHARLQGEAARAANEQLARELFYPLEAIERGLQGEATVLLFLDGAGNVIAARLEASSGHPILDDAAVRAARALRSLPDSAPREALLPVRFRLR